MRSLLLEAKWRVGLWWTQETQETKNIGTCFWSYHQLQLPQHRSSPISPPPKTSKLAVTAVSRHHLGTLLLCKKKWQKKLDHESVNLLRTKKKQGIQAEHKKILGFFFTCESGDHNLLKTVNSSAPHADFAALAPRAAASSWRWLNSVPPANTFFLSSFFLSEADRWWLVFTRISEGAAADASYDDAVGSTILGFFHPP